MPIEVTEEAIAVLRRSLELAQLDPSSGAGVRLRGARALGGGFDVQVELASDRMQDETALVCDGINVYIDRSVTDLYPDAIVAVEPQHETIVVRPKSGA